MAKRPQARKPPKHPKPAKAAKNVEALRHTDDKRLNIPTAEHQSVLEAEHVARKEIRYPRNTDLDPQLVWRGKDYQDWSDLVVQAPPLYIQEKVHPKVLIDDLLRTSRARKPEPDPAQFDLFADFNGVPEGADKTEFYQHDQNWSNRMILGDSLQVMASLAEREGLRGQVQCIYLDPPYGIKFNSNFQWSTTSRDVKDGNLGHITREPEQVKAFRDTWRDGIHSYLTYLRDRLTVARDLLTDSGSIFVQISDENVHRVRALMDEVFGSHNAISTISFRTTSSLGGSFLGKSCDYIIWYGRDVSHSKYRALYQAKGIEQDVGGRYSRVELADGVRRVMGAAEREDADSLHPTARIYRHDNLGSQRPPQGADVTAFVFDGRSYSAAKGTFKTDQTGLDRLARAARLAAPTANSLAYVRFLGDFPASPLANVWSDTQTGAFTQDKTYVVQTNTKVVERCVMMATDPGDLVLDPTCGAGTTATVAEQWGRRLDHHRHLSSRPCARPRPRHGRPLPVLPAGRLP